MNVCKFFFIIIFGSSLFAQELSNFTLVQNNRTDLIQVVTQNGVEYIAVNQFSNLLGLKNIIEAGNQKIKIYFPDYVLSLTAKNPYLILLNKSTGEEQTYQFPTSTIPTANDLLIPLNYSLPIFRKALNKKIVRENPNRIIVLNEPPVEDELILLNEFKDYTEEKIQLNKIMIESSEDITTIRLNFSEKLPRVDNFLWKGAFSIYLKNTYQSVELESDSTKGFVIDYESLQQNSVLAIKFNLTEDSLKIQTLKNFKDKELIIKISSRSESDWLVKESDNFKIIYREDHSYLVNGILSDAENALKVLSNIFDFTPNEKIFINTYDASDYGFGATSTVPHNFIRLEIEPFEPGYEMVPHNEKFQWTISHELLHVVVNEQSGNFEKNLRSILGKVSPEQVQPLTVFYSLLTSYNRYTPRWHQEAIAVFMETWLSGGYGRILGNFDEMYFRSLVVDSVEFSEPIELEAFTSHNSILVESIFYTYGARFIAHLAYRFGSAKVIEWYKTAPGSFYSNFESKFENVFGTEMLEEWDTFIEDEKNFQKENIASIKSAAVTQLYYLSSNPFGWVTQPHYDPFTQTLFWGNHNSHHLAGILSFNIQSRSTKEITSLPTPSMLQVSSTAYDPSNGFLFYTTNNNLLYRDIWVIDTKTNDKKLLFEDYRVGQITVSPTTHDLWGVQHNDGKTFLMFSPFPYSEMVPLVLMDPGDDILQLAVSHDGKLLSAVIHKANGQQLLTAASCEEILKSGQLNYQIISENGSPENPSWSWDDNFIFWNAFTNGVSNIYKFDRTVSRITPLSNTLKGLFKPIEINADSIFAFEFSAAGFTPVILKNSEGLKLPAINYFGQKILNKESKLFDWVLRPSDVVIDQSRFTNEQSYSALSNLSINTIIPVISGFQKKKVLGLYLRIADPLLIHDFTFETGYSPFNEQIATPNFHLRLKYDYKQRITLAIDHNATDFYDLFNKRKRATIGTKFRFGYANYWLFDNPIKIKQNSEIALYTNTEFINDNQVRVTEPDFAVAQTNLNIKNLRRSIGSADFEFGNEFNFTIMAFGSDPNNPNFAAEGHGEWDHFSTYIAPHNVFHSKFSAGYHYINKNLFQAQYFFGGFGNREVENEDVKQFRKVYRFPGVPIYSIVAEQFLKIMFENNFPPIRFADASFAHQFLNHIDFSLFTQGLLIKSPMPDQWIDIGGQVNFIFKHWYNLESTFSAGIAKAWSKNIDDWEWFLSFKILKN